MCSVLAALGVATILAWGGLPVVSPSVQSQREDQRRAAQALRRYLWWMALLTGVTLAAAVLVAGPGLRLVMRLLAMTSPVAKGSLTEAGETVGRISVDGTLGLFMFGGIPGAFVVSALYVLLHRWLPAGRWGGLLVGLLLLVLGSTRVEPLRAENRDFGLVGPGWLAIGAFVVVVVATAMVAAALTGWHSARLPLLSRDWRSWPYYLPLLLALLVLPLGLVIALGGVLAVAVALLLPSVSRWWSSARTVLVGRVFVAVLALIGLPSFVLAMADIVGG